MENTDLSHETHSGVAYMDLSCTAIAAWLILKQN